MIGDRITVTIFRHKLAYIQFNLKDASIFCQSLSITHVETRLAFLKWTFSVIFSSLMRAKVIIAGITHATVAEEVEALFQRNSKYRLNGSRYIHSIGIWDKLISRLKNKRKFSRHLKKRNMFSNMLDNGQGIYCLPTIQAKNTLKSQIDDNTQGWSKGG